ncbi:MAG: flavodoxin, partial [Lachnospiraceae bacterium]|nr:flavodoxin [Lachnospiraceae bacterium]
MQPETTDTADSGQAAESGQQDAVDNSTGQTGKVLVVYYSASGNTKAVAETIAQYTDGDTFEIVPVEAYTSEDLNWTQEGSRVNLEHEDESLQDIALVSTTVEDFDSYDTVFIGYPIWWGIAAWPVNGFVEAND